MNFIQAIGSGFTNYVNFSGRAARSEYWLWVLFTVIGCIAAGILDAALFGYDATGGSPLNAVFDVITFLPSLAIGVRRPARHRPHRLVASHRADGYRRLLADLLGLREGHRRA